MRLILLIWLVAWSVPAQSASIRITSLDPLAVAIELLKTPNVDTVYVDIPGGGGGKFSDAQKIVELTKGMKAICVNLCASSGAFIAACREDHENWGREWFHEAQDKAGATTKDALKWVTENCPNLPDMSVTTRSLGWLIRQGTDPRLVKWSEVK